MRCIWPGVRASTPPATRRSRPSGRWSTLSPRWTTASAERNGAPSSSTPWRPGCGERKATMALDPMPRAAGELLQFPTRRIPDDQVVPPELADYVDELGRMPPRLFAEHERYELAQLEWGE